jgi:ABC-type multidrug transport system ATPase subunit
MNDTQFVIRTEKVGKQYDDITAVKDVSIRIPRGKITGLIGPNGSGKTTLLMMLCGLLSPTEGRITICGLEIAKEKDRIHPLIGYIPQQDALYNDLTVEENICFFEKIFDATDGSQRTELCTALHLEGRIVAFDSPDELIKKRTALSFVPGIRRSRFDEVYLSLTHPEGIR